MKRNNDVYFITLIDLLIQIVFLGLLLYVVAKAGESEKEAQHKSDSESVARLLKATGVSNLTELTDELSKLAPIQELKGTADFIARAGGVNAAGELLKTAQQSGGAAKLEAARVLVDRAGGIDKAAAIIKKFEEGSGKPPCLFTAEKANKSPKVLATISADDTDISFEGTNAELENVLALLGKSYGAVQKLSFQAFASTFSALPRLKPECRYTLRLIERTELVHARDAARFAFYLNISKARE
jgi:hypothetical protein